jgi:hypothetical protein
MNFGISVSAYNHIEKLIIEAGLKYSYDVINGKYSLQIWMDNKFVSSLSHDIIESVYKDKTNTLFLRFIESDIETYKTSKRVTDDVVEFLYIAYNKIKSLHRINKIKTII